MAFYQSSVPKDLRPLNIVRNVIEDPRISPVTLSGTPIEGFYASPPSDVGSSPCGLHTVYYQTTVSDGGFVPLAYNAAIPAATRWVQHVASQPQHVVIEPPTVTSSSGFSNSPKLGGDDSVSCRKVKFLCSFGGKILPRLSDGALRYVGGQTRIITVREDITFGHFLQKMVDTYDYVPNVVIKYQLPDEDLDALVSVSCGDDLENMMDEYFRLVESSSDVSAKLRIFLFSPSELETGGLIHIRDIQESGQKYIEAVNGIMDGSSGEVRIARKESIESTVSAQTTDVSGTDCVDSVGNGLGEATGLSMTAGFSPNSISFEYASFVQHTDASPIVQTVKSGPPTSLGMIPEQLAERSVPLTVPQALPPYVDPQAENLVHSNYVQIPPQIGYAGVQHPIIVGPTPQLYTPFMSMKPNAIPTIIQPQPVNVEHCPRENMVMQRVVQLPSDQGYNVTHFQRPMMVDPRHILLTEKIPRFENCYMCQKQLPHAHSDIVAQEKKESPSESNGADPKSVYRSLHLGEPGWPIIRHDLNGGTNIEPLTGVMMPGAIPSSCGTFTTGPCQNEHAFHMPVIQNQIQTTKDATIIKHYAQCESPKENPVVDFNSSGLEQLIQIDEKFENSRIPPLPAEIFPAIDPIKEDRLGAHCVPTSDSVTDTSFAGDPNLYLFSVLSGTNPIPPIPNNNNAFFSGKDNIQRDASTVSSYAVGDIPYSPALLFANCDLWDMKPDTHLLPPRPCKLQVKRENVGQGDAPIDNVTTVVRSMENRLEDSLDDNVPSHDHVSTTKDVQIKQELQAVAEGVAASVLSPTNGDVSSVQTQSSSTIGQQNGDIKSLNAEMQHRDKFEEIKTKTPEKLNFGFPASGIGRLQIIKNSDLEELRELGSGTFGTVFHGKWRGTDVAIKRINDRCFSGKSSEQDRMRDDFWNEAIKLADLHHPNVVAFYGVVLDGPDDSVATVTEYMVNGSLRSVLQRNERIIDKRKRLLIAMDVAFGMEYLHGKNIVHFDLKSDNLLVNLRDPHRPICKVGDLGLSKVKCNTLISGGVRGTLPWMAPELLNGSSSLVSEKVDVFSYGIVMWELLTGSEPYADLHYGAIIGGIVSNTLRPPVPDSCEADWRAVMERCWSSEPSERPSFSEIADELRAMASKISTKPQISQTI